MFRTAAAAITEKKIAATVQDELFLIPVNIFAFFDWRIPGVWNYIFPFLVGSLRVEQWVKVLVEDIIKRGGDSHEGT